ncbi:MAG: hypothetical protein NC453_19590 [Muribaculum sp.]|nr:hypothetical protein [Muribaculum sp.]
MKKKIDIYGNDSPLLDIPALVISGASIGFLIDGVLLATIGAFFDSQEGSIWYWPAILAGLMNVGLSVTCALLGWLYWKTIVKRKGQLFPRLLGFGLIPALLSLLSTAFVGCEIYFWTIE